MAVANSGSVRAGIDWTMAALSNACIALASLALIVLISTFGWLVFGRYVLNVTPTWVEQLALLLICYITFLGAAAGVFEDTHLGVTFIREAFGDRVEAMLVLLGDVVLAGFGLVMLLASIELVQFGWSTKLPMLNIPESYRTLPSAICGGLIFLFAGMRAGLRVYDHFAPATAKGHG